MEIIKEMYKPEADRYSFLYRMKNGKFKYIHFNNRTVIFSKLSMALDAMDFYFYNPNEL